MRFLIIEYADVYFIFSECYKNARLAAVRYWDHILLKPIHIKYLIKNLRENETFPMHNNVGKRKHCERLIRNEYLI